jgi:hypothetical protein
MTSFHDGATGKKRTNAISLRRTPKPSPIRAAMPRTETRADASLFGIEAA